jgi:lipopolysaccharide biosynthesis protein
MIDPRLICFYLPQFHPIPENDQWWGDGFTEWRNVAQAQPLFSGHYQPCMPKDMGFYDLRVPETRQKQADLARAYGVHGFCYYHYWFSGKTLLERPFQEVLRSGEPDFPFCLCWANENWTRKWDGQQNELLIEQRYSDDEAEAFIDFLLPAFRDPRYIRIDNRPLLIVYHSTLLKDPLGTTRLWRKLARKGGIQDLYLARIENYYHCSDYINPEEHGFDAAIEFPPHGQSGRNITSMIRPAGVSKEEFPTIFDYEDVALNYIRRARPPYKLFRGCMPAWDNTARVKTRAAIYHGSTPEIYSKWLSELVKWTSEFHRNDERIIFINAWNEWAEGAYLEPDQRYGRAFLEATLKCLTDKDC